MFGFGDCHRCTHSSDLLQFGSAILGFPWPSPSDAWLCRCCRSELLSKDFPGLPPPVLRFAAIRFGANHLQRCRSWPRHYSLPTHQWALLGLSQFCSSYPDLWQVWSFCSPATVAATADLMAIVPFCLRRPCCPSTAVRRLAEPSSRLVLLQSDLRRRDPLLIRSVVPLQQNAPSHRRPTVLGSAYFYLRSDIFLVNRSSPYLA